MREQPTFPEAVRVVDAYPQLFVAASGNVYNRFGRLFNGNLKSCGYRAYTIRQADKKHVQVYGHRLVALAWLPIDDAKWQVDHIDGDRLNNNVTNLRWVTPIDNCQNTPKVREGKLADVAKAVIRGKFKYKAQYMRNRQFYYCGVFATPEEAHQAAQAHRQLHGHV